MRVYMFLFIMVLMGCSATQEMSLPNLWKYKKNNVKFSKLNKSIGNRNLIDSLIDLFKSNPYEREYDEIVFSEIKIHSELKLKALIFDVKYVDDMQAIFILNEQNVIVDNYLISSFYN